MALKHLTIVSIPRGEVVEEVHIDDAGAEVAVLTSFRRWLQSAGYAQDTTLRYHFAGARLVDYLIECRAFGPDATVIRVADAIAAYPLFLRDGPLVRWPELPGLGRYAVEIGFDQGLSRNSFAPTLAGANHLLRVAREEELRAIATGREHGIDLDVNDLNVAFAAIEGTEALSRPQKDRLRQSSMLAAVTRMGDRLDRPRGVRSPRRGPAQVDIENKEFPFAYVAPLLEAATCHRDRCLWALLVGGGLRLHEALNLRIVDLDVENREIFVVDPDRRRIPAELRDGQALRFKGRAVSRVYMFEPLRTVFWESVAHYLRSEFVPNGVGGDGFLFVKRDTVDRGRPLVEASDTAVGKSFKAAVRRCGAPGPPEAPDHVWTLHSLRHAYGVYMYNYIPVPDGPGLKLTEVQMLMGHASPQSTAVYARHDRLIVEARVEVANALVFEGMSVDPDPARDLPRVIADRLREAAERLERPVVAMGGPRS